MHATLESIKKELTQIAADVKSTITSNEPFNVVHANWAFPGITRDELADTANALIELIDLHAEDELSADTSLLDDYIRRLTFLRTNTIAQIWGSPVNGISAYLTTLKGLKHALKEAFENNDVKTIDVERVEALKKMRALQTALRTVEARVLALDSRSENLDEKVDRIEQAHEAADQLPTDLETLKESQKTLDDLLHDSTIDRAEIKKILSDITEIQTQLGKSEKEATAIVERCDAAYRATTSEGLASAFAERSRSLSRSMWIWVLGLIVALTLGAIFGGTQLHNLSEALKTPTTTGNRNIEIWVNLFLSLFSVAAPVWFAWISTKQIGQRFRLAEDYGYKASISKAYEGYRREAALLDPDFQARLFSSALTRLDEIPLRLVETETHGSPWQELASSELVRKAAATVPGFSAKVSDLAERALKTMSQKANSHEFEQPKKKTSESEKDE